MKNLKYFLVDLKNEGVKGSGLYVYEHNTKYNYTDIVFVDKNFFVIKTLKGVLSEEDIHKKNFSDEYWNEGYSSDVEELQEDMLDVWELYEKYKDELYEY